MAVKKILIGDKDKSFIEALTERLKSYDFIVAGITSGAQFFQISSQFKMDAVILSSNLQSPSWVDILERFKSSSMYKENMPIMLLSREKSPGLENQAKLHGIQKIIYKPLCINELIELLEKI